LLVVADWNRLLQFSAFDLAIQAGALGNLNQILIVSGAVNFGLRGA
jgi:hypothetical protein